MRTAFEAINVLRWHYGMIGDPKSIRPPAVEPIEAALGMALGMSDPADFECYCPVLIFNKWSPEAVVAQTAKPHLGRLNLASDIGLFFTNHSRLGMPWPMETTTALKCLEQLTADFGLRDDPWNDPEGANAPDGLYLEFFKRHGLYVHWPLADFLKQYNWSLIRNQGRIQQIIEAAARAAA
jgi:hypothetical protein